MDEAMKYAQSELERVGHILKDRYTDLQILEVKMLIARGWERGFSAARASKPAIEEILNGTPL